MPRMSTTKKREHFLKLLDNVAELATKKIPENLKRDCDTVENSTDLKPDPKKTKKPS